MSLISRFPRFDIMPEGAYGRLRAADEQHPLLPALEHGRPAEAQRGADTLRNLRHWVSGRRGNGANRSVEAQPFARRLIMSGNCCVWRSSFRQ